MVSSITMALIMGIAISVTQASLLAAAARTAEASVLKQDLKRSEDELGLTKRHLEERKGKKYPCLCS